MTKFFLKTSITAAILLILSTARAAELTPFWSNGIMAVKIAGLNYPKALANELDGGLTTKFLINISALNESNIISQYVLSLWIKFDLWDEDYTITLATDKKILTKVHLASKNAVLAYLGSLEVPLSIRRETVIRYQSISIKVDMILNPLKKEKLDKIKKWVAKNSMSHQAGSGVLKTNGPRTANLFNYIVKHNDLGENIAASWRATIHSAQINTKDIINEQSKN